MSIRDSYDRAPSNSYSEYYVTMYDESRRPSKMWLRKTGGLMQWLDQNAALTRRVTVSDPAEFQAMLDEGRLFRLCRFNPRRNNFKSLIELNSETTTIEGDMMRYRDADPRPFAETGALESDSFDPYCLDSFVLEVGSVVVHHGEREAEAKAARLQTDAISDRSYVNPLFLKDAAPPTAHRPRRRRRPVTKG